MGSNGALRTIGAALFITLMLLASSPGVADLPRSDDLLDDLHQDASRIGDRDGTADLAREAPDVSALRGPDPQADLVGWLEWSQDAPLPLLIEHARDFAPEAGQQIVPAPDLFPAYAGLPEPAKRDAWRSWWMSTEIAALRSPSIPLDPVSTSASEGNPSYQQQEGASRKGDRNPFGDPHSLDQLWRLQVHGPPRILLPAGPGDETYLVTDRGVLFLPSPGAPPDWMLHVEGIAGHAEVVERDGAYDLVVGIHSLELDAGTPSIWVIDGEAEEIRFSGLTGERAMLHWTLTDVDGDGQEDILGVDVGGNVTAIGLDGEEIYRKDIPQPEELPTSQDVPSLPEGLDQYVALALERTGLETFGDATGDGIQDVFTTSTYGLATLQNAIVVSLVDGYDGEVVWSQVLEPAADAIMRLVMPTVSGDLDGDGLDDVNVLDYYWGFFAGGKNLYLAGDDGLILAQDDPMLFSVSADGVIAQSSYIPLGFLDLNGDGTKQIVTIGVDAYYTGERWETSYRSILQTRTILPVPGGPTLLEDSYFLQQIPWSVPASWIQHSVVEDGGKESLVLLFPHFLTPGGHNGHLVTVDDAGISEKEPSLPIGHFAVNPQTGQRYAWFLHDDRFTPVGKDLEPTGNGTRLILSAMPLLTHDEDGDGTPDLLTRRSMGYFWISGKTGRILDSIDRPMGNIFLHASLQEDGHVLERDLDHYIVYDVKERETVASVSRRIGDGSAYPRALGDFTGDGQQEILLRQYGWGYTSCDQNGCTTYFEDDEWIVYSPTEPGIVWEAPTEMGVGFPGKFLPDRTGSQLMIMEWDGSRTNVTAYAPTKEGNGILWNQKFDYVNIYGSTNTQPKITDGHVVFYEQGQDGDRVVVLDGSTGETLRSLPFEGGQLVWIRLVEGGDAPYLVSSVMEGSEDRRRQYVTTVDISRGETLTTFRLQDPIVHTTTFEYIGGTITVHNPVVNQPGPAVGDWDRDGTPDLALTERNWPVVRSLEDGELVAVGPTFGRFTFTEDLNNDGQQEIAMDAGGSLRMYSFDPSIGRLDEEDPFSRVETIDPDQGDNNTTTHRFFEDEEEKSPGPAVVIVPLLIGLLVAAARRRRDRQ